MSVMEIWLQASKGINVGDPLIHAYWKLWLKCYCACLEVAVHTLCQSDYSQKVKAKDFCFCRWSADFLKNLKTKHCSESLRKQIRELTKLKLKSLRHCFLYGLCRLVLTLILYFHLETHPNFSSISSSGKQLVSAAGKRKSMSNVWKTVWLCWKTKTRPWLKS